MWKQGLLGASLLTLGLGIARAQTPAPAIDVKFYPAEDRKEIEALQGKPAVELEGLQWAQGAPVKLAEVKGRPVMLVFWAQWCGPCVASLPRVQELQAKYTPQGLVVVGIHDPLGTRNLKQLLEKGKITAPQGVETVEKKNVKNYRVAGYPTFTFIDRAGNVRYADVLYDSIETAAAALVKEPAPK